MLPPKQNDAYRNIKRARVLDVSSMDVQVIARSLNFSTHCLAKNTAMDNVTFLRKMVLKYCFEEKYIPYDHPNPDVSEVVLARKDGYSHAACMKWIQHKCEGTAAMSEVGAPATAMVWLCISKGLCNDVVTYLQTLYDTYKKKKVCMYSYAYCIWRCM